MILCLIFHLDNDNVQTKELKEEIDGVQKNELEEEIKKEVERRYQNEITKELGKITCTVVKTILYSCILG